GGDKVTFTVKRGDLIKEIVVTLDDRQAAGAPGGNPKRPYSFWYGGQRENVQDKQGPEGVECGGVYRSADAGETWTRINSVNPRPMYFSLIRVDPSDEKLLYLGGIQPFRSTDGGKTFSQPPRGVHDDQHALWIDPKDGRHMIIGTDGGFYVTYDRMATWDHMNQLALGQFYHGAVCTKKPYFIYGGLQDNGTWGVPSMSLRQQGPINEDVIPISGGDGYVCRVDQNDPDQIYSESQNGVMSRYNLRTGERAQIRPANPGQGAPRYRFNWNTPFILSNHNSNIFYCGGNYLFRSVKKGDDLHIISPELTRTPHGSATAVAESPRNPDVLWAGTDDGNLWVTKNGGKDWKNVQANVGIGKPIWVSTIETSRYAEGHAYVVFDAHRSDDDEPYVYKTEDWGDTWKSLKGNLPPGSSRCLREDVRNPNLLFLGTEFSLFASINRGQSWTKLNNNLPTVAVHEIAVHPTAGDIVAATHGRSIWALDVTPLRQMAADALKAKAKLYRPNVVVNWKGEPERGSVYGVGSRKYVGQNPPGGAQIYYSLTKKADKLGLKVLDYAGNTLQTMQNLKTEPGLHMVAWNALRQGGGPGGRGGFGGFRRVPAGTYRVVLTADGEEQSQPLRVEDDPNL
ncbi:MAG TPA: hypothetical protein VGX76_21000, partial [Pirellulales bacterium]|nr:hypothetical protein [Pirellulales bacterium]